FEGRQNIQSLAWLQVGIPMMLQSALAEAEGLDVVPEERARAMAQRLGLGDLDDLQHMHQLVAQLPIDVAVTGFYFLAGEQLRIDATVWDVASGQAHGSVRVTGPEAEIFAMLDDLTARLRAKLDAL